MISNNNFLNNDDFNVFKKRLISELIKVSPNLGLNHSNKKLSIFINFVDYVINNIYMDISLDEMANTIDVSKFEICRLFSENFRTSPMRWIWEVRIKFAREYIKVASHWSLTDISNACGFNSLAHFSRCFSKAYNISPLKYKNSISQTKHSEEPYDIIYGDKRNSFSRSVVLCCL